MRIEPVRKGACSHVNITIVTLGLLLLVVVCLAQPVIQWQKSLGGSKADEAWSIQQTRDGGYIVAGSSESNDGNVTGHHGSTDTSDCWIVKLNSSGDIQWQKSLGGSNYDWAYSIQQTSDSGYIMAGFSYSDDGDVTVNHGVSDYWVVKLNSSGDIQWQKSLGGSARDEAWSIQQTSDGGYIVAGGSYSDDGDVTGHLGSFDYWVVKLDSSGSIQWQKSLGGSDWDWACSIQQTSDGGYVVSGGSGSNDGSVTGNHGHDDYWVVKLNSLGDIQWQRSLGGSGRDGAISIQQTSDSGYIVAGSVASNDCDVTGNHGGDDYWVVKLNTSGSIQWQKTLGGSHNDRAYSIQQTTDGGYIVAGFAVSNDCDVTGNHGACDHWVVKLNSSGSIQWQKSLGGSFWDQAHSIQQTSDSGYIVAGLSLSNDGDVTGNHGNYDYWVVKLSPYGGISENVLPKQFAVSVSPNPFNSSCAIMICQQSRLHRDRATVKVEIFDLHGRLVATPFTPTFGRGVSPKGGHENTSGDKIVPNWGKISEGQKGVIIWQPDETISSGVYLVRATTEDGQKITKRIVYLK